MLLPIYQIDAFVSDKPFSGNPAGVCILPAEGEATWMQNVAMEMNLSETAFLVKRNDGYGLRWFTPTVEVDLCGHATLASSHALWERGDLRPTEQVRFHTKSGVLLAARREDFIELDFPAKLEESYPAPAELIKALGVVPLYSGKNQFDYIIEVESEKVVREMKPDYGALRGVGVRGVIVTSRAETNDFDFISRFFAPGSGIDEDPVTGSAHCCLGPYWKTRMKKSEFVAYQASSRGGVIHVRVGGDRVVLGGKARTFLRGEIEG